MTDHVGHPFDPDCPRCADDLDLRSTLEGLGDGTNG